MDPKGFSNDGFWVARKIQIFFKSFRLSWLKQIFPGAFFKVANSI